MKNENSDVMIHTSTALTDDEFGAIASQVNQLQGIVRFQRSHLVPNLIMVVYNSAQTKALTILDKMTRMGFNASLVGI